MSKKERKRYEKNKNKHFSTYEEAAEWFNSHDMADFEDQLKPVDFKFDLRKNRDCVSACPTRPMKSLFPLFHRGEISVALISSGPAVAVSLLT